MPAMYRENMFIIHEAIEPLDFEGLKIIDYTAGLETKSSFAEITVPSGVSHRISWSKRSDKYYYVIHGIVDFMINDERKTLASGDVCIIPKGARFNYSNNGSDDAKLILVHTPNFKLECEVSE